MARPAPPSAVRRDPQPRRRARRRRWADRALGLATGTCAAVSCGLLLGLAAVILARGLPALEPGFLFRETARAGAGGGIRYQLLGTLILIATALVVSLPPAVGVALLKALYLPPAAARRLGLALLVVNGVPSILFGIFGLLVFGKLLGWGKSWLAGGVVLGMMILPTVAVALAERMESLPEHYLKAARGLGLSRSQTAWAVVLPQSAGGLASGVLQGLARAAGETAPILFTAAVFSGAGLPTGIRESPVLALPYHIFTLAQDSLDPEAGHRLWAAAFVLLALVLGLSLAALPARLRLHEEARHG